MSYSAVILAAGKGVRMCSDLPKVVHPVSGHPIILHVVDAVKRAGITSITIVVGHGREQVIEALAGYEVNFVVQEEQLGTGHALMQAKDKVAKDSTMLVLAGDIPLLQTETIKELLDFHEKKKAIATILSANITDPHGYGRIVRDKDNNFIKIVEEKDATVEEKMLKEINSGIYCFHAQSAFNALDKINTENAQGEYYLTDVLEILKKDKQIVDVLLTTASDDISGINDRMQLSTVQAIMYQRKNVELMKNGVTMMDPTSVFIDNEVKIARDTVVLPYSIIEGETTIGSNCEIGPNSRINDSIIGDNVVIENSRIRNAKIGNKCIIGPFAYLRPETVLEENVKIGDFVEIKKSNIGAGSKIPHLSYVGDAKLGKNVNVGAGTITCNYDGYNKYITTLKDGVFIGSNTNLVAPVTIGEKAVTGAGSTITNDVPPNALAIERATQRIITDWAKNQPKKK
ncbi:MAG TPA: bifunctional UDP-N-acetylglucosamine diphosphorylase/glucosamine-1-phosphate N-acetyltransferase GlmU [Syntrophomonadaceae bacterium]|nr:bifunctional UDP-N-acetylglucosamine diphosphorylase/glucosamine-1-phosphate N-acetyltransferase GlmU [Syntrophomonadaceae bacterium]